MFRKKTKREKKLDRLKKQKKHINNIFYDILANIKITNHAYERAEERWLKLYKQDIVNGIRSGNVYKDHKVDWTYRIISYGISYVMSKELEIITIFDHDKDMMMWVAKRLQRLKISSIINIFKKINI